MRRHGFAAGLPALLLLAAAAGPAQGDVAAKAAVERRAAASVSANAEVYRDLLVAGGKSVALDSELDFSAADRVAVTVRCTTCTSQAASMSGVVLQAFWAVPDAEQYSVVESKAGSSFLYWDSGGALFQVFGSRFRLTLQNKGNQGILIDQVVIFRRSP